MQIRNKGIYQSSECITEWAEGCTGTPAAKDYIYSIREILRKDYKNLKCTQFEDKYAWDADAYEIALKKGSDRSETVDFVVGLFNKRLLMVEAKLDVENVDNIKGEIEEKIKNTKRYLVSSSTFTSCACPSVVLFGNKKKNIQRNINKFRKLRNNKTDIVPMSLDDFYIQYFKE